MTCDVSSRNDGGESCYHRNKHNLFEANRLVYFSAVRNIHENNTTELRDSFEVVKRYRCLTHIFQPKVGSSRVFLAFTIMKICEIFVSAAMLRSKQTCKVSLVVTAKDKVEARVLCNVGRSCFFAT